MEYLLVDGYNVINAWRDIFDIGGEPLEDLRDKLLSMLSSYQGYKKINIIVVFDAHQVKGTQIKQESYDNLTVIYTRENETADNYIERFVYRMSADNIVKVVTSDYLEQRIVLTGGGMRITPKELREEMVKANTYKSLSNIDNKNSKNTIGDRIKPDILKVLEKLRRGN